MDDRIWYIYQNSQQMGPFEPEQLKQLISNSMISRDAYLFKVGWKDWRPIEECSEEMGLATEASPIEDSAELDKRRSDAPRATIKGRVDVHNDAQFSTGIGVNISSTGIFVETDAQIFQIGEHLKLTVRTEVGMRPFNVTAQVMRFNADSRWPVGYGLRFENIQADIKDEIQRLVDNQGPDPKRDQVSSL